MTDVIERIWCDECAVEITWTPVVIDNRPYCCHDCAIGLECRCAIARPRWEDDAQPLWPPLWPGSLEGNTESVYSLDYGFD
jgi:hypothetical protein